MIEQWIDGYSNCGTKIKTIGAKNALKQLQEKYPEKNYNFSWKWKEQLWYIEEREAE